MKKQKNNPKIIKPTRFIREKKGQFVIVLALLIASLTLAAVISIHSINTRSQVLDYEPANEFLLGLTSDMNRALTASLAKYTDGILNQNLTPEQATQTAYNFMDTWKKSTLTAYSSYGIKLNNELPQNMIPTFLNTWATNDPSNSYAYIPYAFDVDAYGFIGWTGTTAKYVQLQITDVEVINWPTGPTHVEFQLMQSDIDIKTLRPIPDLPKNPSNNNFRIGKYNDDTNEFINWPGTVALTYLGNGNYRATLSNPPDEDQAISPIRKGLRIELATPNDAIWIQNTYILPKAPSITTLQLSKSEITFGETITATATVTGLGPGFPNPTGKVNFATETGSIGEPKTITKNINTVTSDPYAPQKADNYDISAHYDGDYNYEPSDSNVETLIVHKATPTVTTLLSAIEITLGGSPSSVTDTAHVTNVGPGFSGPTGQIIFQVRFGSGSWATFSIAGLNPSGTALSEEYTPYAAGTYYFRAIYQGDENYNSAQSGDEEEQLVVKKATPTVTTLLDPPAIRLGGVVRDHANVTGLGEPYPAPTGTVTFEVSTDNGQTWTAFTANVQIENGKATSEYYQTDPAIYTYYFRAIYSGDENYELAASGNSDEPLTPGQVTVITSLSSSSIQLGETVYDTAIVYGIDKPPTGTVRFEYRKVATEEWTLLSIENLIPDPGTNTSIATSPEVYLKNAGNWYFRAVYSGDDSYRPAASGDTAEPITVRKANPIVTTILSAETITLGEPITDTAIVTGLGGEFPIPTGLITFQASPDNGQTWITFDNTKTLTEGTATSDAYIPNKAVTWYFRAFYQGDENYNSAYSDDNAEPLTVNKAPTTTTTLLSKSTIIDGEIITDTATVQPQTGQTPYIPYPTGTVIFQYSTNGGVTWNNFGSQKNLFTGSAVSDSYTPYSVGNWSFRAVYLGDDNYLPSESGPTEEPLRVNMIPGTVGDLIISAPSVSGRNPFITNSTTSPLNPYDKINPQLSEGHKSITITSNTPLPTIETADQINITLLLQTTMVTNIPYQTVQVDLGFTYQDRYYSIGTVIFDAIASKSNPPPIYYNLTINVAGKIYIDICPPQVIPRGSILQLTLTLINPQNRVDVFGGIAGSQIKLF
ncbi:MAG: Ig-like domain-containing protein [Candidatus Bathyarchaeia archaeon]